MPKKLFLLPALVLSALLFAPSQRASAASPYDLYAYDDLVTGFEYAMNAYEADPSDPNAYDAALYGYYAQYYASVADNSDNQFAWYYAYLLGSTAADHALAVYEDTGDIDSGYAHYYLSTGATYALYAYLTFA